MGLKGYLVLTVLVIIITTVAIIYQNNASRMNSMKPFTTGSSADADRNTVKVAEKSTESSGVSANPTKSEKPKESNHKDEPATKLTDGTNTVSTQGDDTDAKSMGEKIILSGSTHSKDKNSDSNETADTLTSDSSTESPTTTTNPILKAPQAPTQVKEIVNNGDENTIRSAEEYPALIIASDRLIEATELPKVTKKPELNTPQVITKPKGIEIDVSEKKDINTEKLKQSGSEKSVENAEPPILTKTKASDATKIAAQTVDVVNDGTENKDLGRDSTSTMKIGLDKVVENSESRGTSTTIFLDAPQTVVKDGTEAEIISTETPIASKIGSDKLVQGTEPPKTSDQLVLGAPQVQAQPKDIANVQISDVPKKLLSDKPAENHETSSATSTNQAMTITTPPVNDLASESTVSSLNSTADTTVDDQITINSSSQIPFKRDYNSIKQQKSSSESVLAGYKNAIAKLKKPESSGAPTLEQPPWKNPGEFSLIRPIQR